VVSSTKNFASLQKIYGGLKLVGLVLLVAGLGGPWQYGSIGRSGEFGWQPVWATLVSFIALNIFILFSIASCLSYLELYLRLGRPVLQGAFRWIGAFFVLIIGVPLFCWLIFNQAQRSPIPQTKIDTFGWGMWVTVVGQIIQVAGLRLQIWQVRQSHKEG